MIFEKKMGMEGHQNEKTLFGGAAFDTLHGFRFWVVLTCLNRQNPTELHPAT